MHKNLVLSLLLLGGASIAVPVLTSAAAPAPVPAAAPAKAIAYTIDTVHSTILFSTMHLGTSRAYGRFNAFAGTFTIDAEKPEASKVEIQVKMESVDTANSGRDDHLRGPDFFDVKQFPTATFTSSKVEKKGDGLWHVSGTLNLHGVRKEVVIPMTKTGEGKGQKGEALIGFHGTFKIQRSEFGIRYGIGGIGDEVEMTLSVEAAAS
jgi:polyisoprenoid-binding protein YceI